MYEAKEYNQWLMFSVIFLIYFRVSGDVTAPWVGLLCVCVAFFQLFETLKNYLKNWRSKSV